MNKVQGSVGGVGLVAGAHWELGGGALTSIYRGIDHLSVSPHCSSNSANLMYSPTIGALEHDRIAIERHVENENPNGRGNPAESQAEERNAEYQYKRRAMAYLCAFHCAFGASQELMAVHSVQGRTKEVQVQPGPYGARNEPFDQCHSDPVVKHGFDWVNGLKTAGKA
jgi:hypothetical protein